MTLANVPWWWRLTEDQVAKIQAAERTHELARCEFVDDIRRQQPRGALARHARDIQVDLSVVERYIGDPDRGHVGHAARTPVLRITEFDQGRQHETCTCSGEFLA